MASKLNLCQRRSSGSGSKQDLNQCLVIEDRTCGPDSGSLDDLKPLDESSSERISGKVKSIATWFIRAPCCCYARPFCFFGVNARRLRVFAGSFVRLSDPPCTSYEGNRAWPRHAATHDLGCWPRSQFRRLLYALNFPTASGLKNFSKRCGCRYDSSYPADEPP